MRTQRSAAVRVSAFLALGISGCSAAGRSATSGKDYEAEVRFTCEDR